MMNNETPKKIGTMKHNPVNITKTVFVYFFLVLFLLWILVPFYIILVTSFKTEAEVNETIFTWFPVKGFYFGGYKAIFETPIGYISIMTGFLNTLWIILPPTILGLLTSAFSAYAFAKLKFRGKNVLFAILLATMMIPAMALLIPIYKLLANMGLVNSYLGIIIPRLADVGGIFLLRQFFISIPKDLDNAARIDGAGEFRIFLQIILPNSVPAILTVGMFNFMGNWNDLLWPLIMTSKPATRTITAGLAMLTGHGSSVTPYGVVMAGALISALPLIIVFFFVQKRFVEGIAMTGMK